MAKLKIIPLGGLGEIGKNLTVYEYGEHMIVVDCGLGFPDEELLGVDIVIPDVSYLKQNKHKLLGIVITHGHEDHIGALPYVIKELDVPIYATALAAGIIQLKFEEHDLLHNTQIFTKKAGDHFKLGCFDIEMIHVNHSIADAVSLAIGTPLGTVIHMGDFKIDLTPVSGEMIDLVRFGQLGKRGVLALLSDSTNVEKPGHSDSERKVGESFDKLFTGCDKRIIVTTFASNIQRIQQIIDVAVKHGRKVAVSGRSMENMLKVAIALEYMNIPDGVLVELNKIKNHPKNKTVIISTGSQGENMSALHRMAFNEHKQISIDSNDRIIISASAIPGNETTVSRVIDALFQKGADVIYDRHTDLHVSGHASQEEQKMILALTKPKFFIPVHGEYRMLVQHADIAKMMGVKANNTVVTENGKVIEMTKKTIKVTDTVPSGRVFVDGTGVGDVGSVVLRDRKHLAEDGMIVVILTVGTESKSLISPPEIVTRGFVYEKEAEALITEMKRVVAESLVACKHTKVKDQTAVKNKIKTNLTGYLYKTTRRSPMILPVITEVSI